MNQYYVYAWTRLDTNEVFYIGKGHGLRYKDMRMRNRYFLNIVNKLGMDNIRIDFLEENLSEAEAFERETYWISYYRNHSSCLTNMTDGGEGSSGWFQYLSPEQQMHHKEISKSFSGKKHTEETKQKMRESMRGKKHHLSEDGRARLSKAASSRPGVWKGKHLSEETKRKISQTRKIRYGPPKRIYDPENRKLPKSVYVYDADGKLLYSFESIAACARFFHDETTPLSSAYIKKLLKGDGKIKSAKMRKHPYFGYIFTHTKLTSPSTIETVSLNELNESNGVE